MKKVFKFWVVDENKESITLTISSKITQNKEYSMCDNHFEIRKDGAICIWTRSPRIEKEKSSPNWRDFIFLQRSSVVTGIQCLKDHVLCLEMSEME